MNKSSLSNIIALGEGFTTEFKRSMSSNLGREICKEGLIRFDETPCQDCKVDRDLTPESQPESRQASLEQRVLSLLIQAPLSKSSISTGLGQKTVSGQLNKVIRALRKDGLIKYTIPEKPGSRLQKYQITENGRNRLVELVN